MTQVDRVIWLLIALVIVALVAAFVLRPMKVARGIEAVPGPVVPGAPLPVILVHGLFGFDRMARFDYFRGIAKHLESIGCHAHAVKLPRARSVPERARALCDAIMALPHERVDLIAHSMGGLDARYALAHFGLASRVRSLVTVGTPHRGTPLADLATDGALGVARRALAAMGISLTALDWLTTSALERFNRETLDVPGVRYACVVGTATHVPLALAPAHAYLRKIVGDNDGLVPKASQYWGETFAEIEADHFAQIGWTRGEFDVLALYALVVGRLHDLPATEAQSSSNTL
jgi:triacylglycerol lipase